jgi:hypothetical protein
MWMTSGTANQALSSALFTTANIITNAANCIIINGDYSACRTGLSACSIYVFDRCLNIGGCTNFIGGGILNTSSGVYNFIGGGICNTNTSIQGSIGGGICNLASGRGSAMPGGAFNNISSVFGAIGGGSNNSNSGYRSVVTGGGSNNVIAQCASINGGFGNVICSAGLASSIGGGNNNLITGARSVIAGGSCNIVSGACSFVAGGSANDTKGFENTFILGTALSASVANFTYVNNLSSQGVVVANPLRVGNSQAATGPVGSVTGKVEIFNATGTSLGFIPVYDTIT